MRKKIISTILVTAMIFSVTGCGNKDDNEATKNTKETTTITEEETTNKVAEVETGYLDTLESYEIDISSDWIIKAGNETFTILGDKWEAGAYVNKGSKINCFGYFDTENYVITVNSDCTKATVYKKDTSTITADNETTVTNNNSSPTQNGNTSNNVSNNNNYSNGNSNAYTPSGNGDASSNNNGSDVHVVIGNPDYNSPTHGGVMEIAGRMVGEKKSLSNGTRYITYCYNTYIYEDGFKEVDKEKEVISDFSVITENYSDVANIRYLKINSCAGELLTSIDFKDEDFIDKRTGGSIEEGLTFVDDNYKVYIRKDNKKEFDGSIKSLLIDIEEDRIIKDLGIKNLSTDMEKVVEIVNYIYSTCSYGVGNKYEMLLGSHKGVCDNASDLVKDFMNKLGLENCYVDSNTINHAWNAVLIDGLWWYVDATPYGSPSIYHQWDTVTFETNYQYGHLTDKKFKDDNLNEVPAPPINTKYNYLDVYYKTKKYDYK